MRAGGFRTWPCRALVGALVGVVGLSGCGGPVEATEAEQRDAGAELLTAMELRDVTGPRTVRSKDLEYQVGRGIAQEDDPAAAVDLAVTTLQTQGWEVRDVEPVPGGQRVLADGDGLAARVSVYEKVAGSAPSGGGVWLQVAVAVPHDRMSWTLPSP